MYGPLGSWPEIGMSADVFLVQYQVEQLDQSLKLRPTKLRLPVTFFVVVRELGTLFEFLSHCGQRSVDNLFDSVLFGPTYSTGDGILAPR